MDVSVMTMLEAENERLRTRALEAETEIERLKAASATILEYTRKTRVALEEAAADNARLLDALSVAEPHLGFLHARNPENQYVAQALAQLRAALALAQLGAALKDTTP